MAMQSGADQAKSIFHDQRLSPSHHAYELFMLVKEPTNHIEILEANYMLHKVSCVTYPGG